MKKLLATVVAGLLCLLASGCIQVVQTVRLDDTLRASTRNVQLYADFGRVPWTYKEVALLIADDQGNGYTEARLIEMILSEARKLGADGVVLTSQSAGSAEAAIVPIGGMLVAGVFQRTVVRAR